MWALAHAAFKPKAQLGRRFRERIRGGGTVRLALTRRHPHPIPSAAIVCFLHLRTSGGGQLPRSVGGVAGVYRVGGEAEAGR